MEQLKKFFSFAWSHKGKLGVLAISTLVFAFLLFPFNDLSDFIGAQISKMSRNKVYVQFDQLHMSLVPTPGVALENVQVEAQGLAGLKIQEAILTPGFSTLITQKPAGTLTARGFLNGDIQVSLKSGARTDDGKERQEITIEAKKLSLGELKQIGQLPFVAKGDLNLSSKALIEPTLKTQPDVDVTLRIDQFQPLSVQTPLGPFVLPELKISNVELKGRLSAGKLIIEQGIIGKETDELRGTIKGSLDLQIIRPDPDSTVIIPQMGGYNFDVDLKVKKGFYARASTIFSIAEGALRLNNHKIDSADGVQYRFKVQGANFIDIPNVSALR
ncbi:MAG: type II secretion system protein GspN [Pseudobdellovibrionaceae bacterium]